MRWLCVSVCNPTSRPRQLRTAPAARMSCRCHSLSHPLKLYVSCPASISYWENPFTSDRFVMVLDKQSCQVGRSHCRGSAISLVFFLPKQTQTLQTPVNALFKTHLQFRSLKLPLLAGNGIYSVLTSTRLLQVEERAGC